MTTIHITRGLAEGLLEMASDAEPASVAVGLGITAAGDLDGVVDVPPDTPVYTHFYHPDAGRSVNAVFGMDVGTPVGSTRGRFVSHPQGRREIALTDDLHAVVFVAVPPWDIESLAAFDRHGGKKPIALVDGVPPARELR